MTSITSVSFDKVVEFRKQIMHGDKTNSRPSQLFENNVKKMHSATCGMIAAVPGLAVLTALTMNGPNFVMGSLMVLAGYQAVETYKDYKKDHDSLLVACVAHRMGIDPKKPEGLVLARATAFTALAEDKAEKRPFDVLKSALSKLVKPADVFETDVKKVMQYKGAVRPFPSFRR